MDIAGMIAQISGSGNMQALEQAAEEHVQSMSSDELTGHLQTAADTANSAGAPSVASEISGVLAGNQLDTAGLKTAAIDYIRSNPQVLTHFAPSFAQGILNRVI